ncbi:alpha/beta hydrolase [uncultured Amnibacterium sp.]|uniref:alpha/beta hydrolase n=1 Tax=uncultured Amnibacterium sp. TaxID=1631851 RepID=UPI0035CA444A
MGEDSRAGSAVDVEVRSGVQLVAERHDIELTTADGVTLVGELAVPAGVPAVAALVCVHPLPTAGGFMDSHILRKAAARLPALARIAVLRFNTRGTTSPRGTSGGSFDGGDAEGLDLAAAVDFAAARGLPTPWLLGWSFGTDVVLRHGLGLSHGTSRSHGPGQAMAGAVLLSPPLRSTTEADLRAWGAAGTPLTVLVPEFDDFLRPAEARLRFAAVPQADLIAVAGAKHLWVGEPSVRRVLTEVVAVVNPAVLPLPERVPAALLA